MARNGSRKPNRHLTLKGKTYWAKIEVPKDCRATLRNKTAIVESMETGDISIARQRRDEWELSIKKIYQSIRNNTYDPAGTATSAAARGEIWREALMALERAKEIESYSQNHRHQAKTDDVPLSVEEMDEVYWASEDDLSEAVYAEEAYRENLRGADAEAYDNALHQRVPFDNFVGQYLKSANLAEKTTKERRGLLKMVSDWYSTKNINLADLNRKLAGFYVSEVLETLDPSTANKRLGAIRGYWNWLYARGHIDETLHQIWEGQLLRRNKKRIERGEMRGHKERPFTDDEVAALLYSTWPDNMKKVSDQALILDALKTSLLSGMRIAEIINLRVEDIQQDTQQRLYFTIQEGKNASAIRKVPISNLVSEMIHTRLSGKKPSDMVFHEPWTGRTQRQGSAADQFGKAFARYRKNIGVHDQPEGKRRSLVNFHSARRWFITEARRQNIPLDQIAAVVGHMDDTLGNKITRHYFGGFSDEQLWEVVNAVALPSNSHLIS